MSGTMRDGSGIGWAPTALASPKHLVRIKRRAVEMEAAKVEVDLLRWAWQQLLSKPDTLGRSPSGHTREQLLTVVGLPGWCGSFDLSEFDPAPMPTYGDDGDLIGSPTEVEEVETL